MGSMHHLGATGMCVIEHWFTGSSLLTVYPRDLGCSMVYNPVTNGSGHEQHRCHSYCTLIQIEQHVVQYPCM